MSICADIWGGADSQDHLARYILPIEEALHLARRELADGFLINLRAEPSWGPEQNFDERITNQGEAA